MNVSALLRNSVVRIKTAEESSSRNVMTFPTLIRLDDCAFFLKLNNVSIIVFEFENSLALIFHILEDRMNKSG
jgi:hypothetical protein